MNWSTFFHLSPRQIPGDTLRDQTGKVGLHITNNSDRISRHATKL